MHDIMNKAGFIFLLFIFIVSLKLQAQEEALKISVNIHADNITVRELLDTISTQTGLYFSYSNTLLNDTAQINISADSTQLNEILHMLVPREKTALILKDR